MARNLLLLLGICLAGVAQAQDASGAQGDNFDKPRSAASFAAFFAKSPFVMPSASEISALADRYVIAGTMKINNDPRLILLDKSTSARLLVSKDPDTSEGGITLIALQDNPDPALVRATISVDGTTGVIAFASDNDKADADNKAAKSASTNAPAQTEIAQNQPAMTAIPDSAASETASSETAPPRKAIPIHHRKAPLPGSSPSQSSSPSAS